jgi:transposase
MTYRELTMMDVKELLRRHRAGQGIREIARETGTDRKTVRRYLEAARSFAEDQLSDEQVLAIARQVQLRELPAPSEPRVLLAQHRAQLEAWLDRDRPLKLTKVHALLERRGVCVSYPTLRRYVIDELGWGCRRTSVRVDDPPPAQEAQADFGRMGRMRDPETGKMRTLYVLIVTLAFSRHQFVWPTFVQTVEAVCEGLDAAWRFFGGVPHRLVVDNLKPVVAKADSQAPTITEAFTEYAQSRGLFVDPTRVRDPQGKARVENQVAYVRESWFEGESFESLDDARRLAREWCLTTAGTRIHGTTRRVPLQVYENEERPLMLPAPTSPFDVPRWVDATVHPDHHIKVAHSLYSVPTRYVGQQVRVRVDRQLVKIYARLELIKTHPRQAPGGRSTDTNDYPTGKAPYATRSVDDLCDRAYEEGTHVGHFVARLLDGPLPWTRMRQAYGMLRLCKKYGRRRVDEACKRALAFDVLDTRRVERTLKTAMRTEADATERGTLVQLPVLAARFARTTDTFETRKREREEER